jgi:hypothetical protein
LAPLPWNTAPSAVVNDDASKRSDGRANGSNKLINVQLDIFQGKSYMVSDRVALFYESLTSLYWFRCCTSTSEPLWCWLLPLGRRDAANMNNSMLRPRSVNADGQRR